MRSGKTGSADIRGTGTGKYPVIFWAASVLVVALIMIVPTRYFYFLHGIPRLQFACPFLVIVAVAAWIWCALSGRISRSWLAVGKRCWPVIALTAFDLAFLAFAYVTRTINPLVAYLPPAWWWGNAFFLAATPVAAFFLGLANRRAGNRRLGIALLVVLAISFVVAAAEYLHLSGYHNPIGYWLLRVNAATNPLYAVWKWTPIEPIRAQGLNSNPNCFAFTAAIGACWALAARGLKGLRVAVFLLSLASVLLAGSRSVILALACVAVASVVVQLRARGLRGWFKAQGKVLAAVLAGCLAFILAFSLIGGGTFQSVSRSLKTVTTLAADTGSDTVDAQDLSSISSGRSSRWGAALSSIAHHPFGTGQPYLLTARQTHPHNDFLNRWVTGGPLAVFVYGALLFWFLFCLLTPDAPRFGVYIGIFMLIVGLFDCLFARYPFVAPVLFIAGVLASREWTSGKLAFTRWGRRSAPRPQKLTAL
ncbi:MAG: O-antigen ligase family protein [Coriobacteriia bacterium]|nr:O-antigen ligase family protein [Coriobacteriia bacterium]